MQTYCKSNLYQRDKTFFCMLLLFVLIVEVELTVYRVELVLVFFNFFYCMCMSQNSSPVYVYVQSILCVHVFRHIFLLTKQVEDHTNFVEAEDTIHHSLVLRGAD
jgi:hypothetical protein